LATHSSTSTTAGSTPRATPQRTSCARPMPSPAAWRRSARTCTRWVSASGFIPRRPTPVRGASRRVRVRGAGCRHVLPLEHRLPQERPLRRRRPRGAQHELGAVPARARRVRAARHGVRGVLRARPPGRRERRGPSGGMRRVGRRTREPVAHELGPAAHVGQHVRDGRGERRDGARAARGALQRP
jgi:hypothetical protein